MAGIASPRQDVLKTNPSNSNVTSFGNSLYRGHQVKMRPLGGPSCSVTGVPLKRGTLDIAADMHMGKMV